MSLVVLVVSGTPEQISLGPRSATALADLGVTSVALASGDRLVALVLEGWAFDPSRAGEAAAAVGARSAAALTTVAQIVVPKEALTGESVAGPAGDDLEHRSSSSRSGKEE